MKADSPDPGAASFLLNGEPMEQGPERLIPEEMELRKPSTRASPWSRASPPRVWC